VAYLQLFISELRGLHFKTPSGPVLGASFVDPVWARIVAWNADDVPRVAAESTRELVKSCLAARPDAATLLAKYDALAEDVKADA